MEKNYIEEMKKLLMESPKPIEVKRSTEKLIKCHINNKVVEERHIMRKVLLAMNGKIILKNGLESENFKTVLQMYSFYKPNNYPMRVEEVIKEIRELWLIEISAEDGLLRTKDIAQTDNWIVESVELIMEKLEKAWGYCDYAMVNNYFMIEVIDTDKYKK